MRQAWSVIGGEAKTEVALRFSPAVRARVLKPAGTPQKKQTKTPKNQAALAGYRTQHDRYAPLDPRLGCGLRGVGAGEASKKGN